MTILSFFFQCFLQKNGKHFLPLATELYIVSTFTKVWENSRKILRHSPIACVPCTAFLILSNFHLEHGKGFFEHFLIVQLVQVVSPFFVVILVLRCGRQQYQVQVQQGSVWLMWMEMDSWKLFLLHWMGRLIILPCFPD